MFKKLSQKSTKLIALWFVAYTFEFISIFYLSIVLLEVDLNSSFSVLKSNIQSSKVLSSVLSSKNTKQSTESISVDEVSIFEKNLEPVFTKPETLEIYLYEIKLPIIEVGVEDDGSLETPKDWLKAGWYKKSSMPGQVGNMIINAHYDDNYGRPAAFYKLKNVNLNDKVVITDKYGKSYEYLVTDKYFVSINDPNRLSVFENHKESQPTITLITCGGVWVPGKSTYNQRLVVKGELIQ